MHLAAVTTASMIYDLLVQIMGDWVQLIRTLESCLSNQLRSGCPEEKELNSSTLPAHADQNFLPAFPRHMTKKVRRFSPSLFLTLFG
jgi:hypothetical protein